MNLSFFAKEPYFDGNKNRLMRGSTIIRAQQTSEYLGAKYNPTEGYENDICIYVKPDSRTNKDFSLKFNNKTYIDFIDNGRYIQWLHEHVECHGIVASKYAYDILKNEMPNRVVFIPQQHCNFENFLRDRKEIINVGIIGSPRTFHYYINKTGRNLKKKGLQLLTNFDFQTREDVVNFYKNIDIQIVWFTKHNFFKNPLKIINAASFGIPTVGYPHPSYKEVDGFYIKAQNIDSLINEVEALKDPKNYVAATKNLLQMAENYHINKIAEKYKALL